MGVVNYASLKGPIDFYKQEVEPAFAALSCLRNKKRAIGHYLHIHPGIPEDVGRSLIQKMDRLERMIQTMDAHTGRSAIITASCMRPLRTASPHISKTWNRIS